MRIVKRTAVLVLLLISLPLFALTHDECNQRWEQIEQDFDVSQVPSLRGLCDQELKKELHVLMKNNKELSYYEARQYLFEELFNVAGYVCGVYSGKCIETTTIPDHQIMNLEHSWPQSKGAVNIAKSDLHHLYPAVAEVNSSRGNRPFCEVSHIKKNYNGSFSGTDQFNQSCFEPRNLHKGEVARAMFYFAIRYQKEIDYNQEQFFRSWHEKFVATSEEKEREELIDTIQENRNFFIDYPFLISLISDF